MKKIFSFILGMFIVFLIQYFCIFILKLFKINFPAPILGIIILYIFLKFKIIKENWVKDFCQFITKHMILFFIPIFVGIINYSKLIQDNLMILFITIFITTILTIALVGLLMENIIKYKRLYHFKRRVKWFIVSAFFQHYFCI